MLSSHGSIPKTVAVRHKSSGFLKLLGRKQPASGVEAALCHVTIMMEPHRTRGKQERKQESRASWLFIGTSYPTIWVRVPKSELTTPMISQLSDHCSLN